MGGFTDSILLVAHKADLQENKPEESEKRNGWVEENGIQYWYEDGIKLGTEGRGKEIYDPDSDAWYWLDSVQNGAKAVGKDVYMESNGGKWVRYDENGRSCQNIHLYQPALISAVFRWEI